MTLPHGYASPYHFDMALQEPVHYMMRRGIRVDMSEKSRLSNEYHTRWKAKQDKLNRIAGHELNVNSHVQIKKWLYEELELPVRKHNGKPTSREEALRNLLSLCQKKVETLKTRSGRERWLRGYLSIMMILEIRSLRKRISSYIDVDVDTDFRMRTTLSVGGTETGRFSSSKTLWDTGVNLQTIPYEIRIIFVADPGKELAEIDLNRGESWIYSHLSEDPEMMYIHQNGLDFHAHTAAALSRDFSDREWEPREISLGAKEHGNKEAYKLRYLGKRANHAFAYRMGPHRAAEVVNKEADDTGITVRVSDTKKMRRIWLQKYMGIPSWWDAIERELSDDRTMETVFGRKRTFYGHWGPSLFKDATAHVPQSTSVDYLNTGLLGVYHNIQIPGKWGLEILHQNHDSLIIQYDEGHRNEVFPAIFAEMDVEMTINGHDIIIPKEAEFGQNWGNLTEWKGEA